MSVRNIKEPEQMLLDITDDTVIHTQLIDLVICTTSVGQTSTRRYCIVHNTKDHVTCTNQYKDITTDKIVSEVNKDVFEDLKELLTQAMNHIHDLERELEMQKVKAESANIIIDTLRKNGVID